MAIYAYLENQARDRPIVVVFLDPVNQELRKRGHDLGMLAKSRYPVSRQPDYSACKSAYCAMMSLFP